MRLHAVSAGVTSFLVYLLAAASAGAATPKACDLVTAQTAATLAGEAVGDQKEVEAKDKKGDGCKYTSKSGGNIGIAIVDMAADDAKSYMSAMRSMVAAPATTEVIPGLGEQNFLLVRPESQKNQNALLVIYHGKSLTLGVQRKMTPDVKAAMVQVMRGILSKI
jgi:hypothetical protein